MKRLSISYLKYSIVLLFVLLMGNVYSQEKYDRRISVSEWIEEMVNCKDSKYILTNTEIYYDYLKDRKHNYALRDSILNDQIISPLVFMINCKLPIRQTFFIKNLIFKRNLTIMSCTGANDLRFKDCVFTEGLDLKSSNLQNLHFFNCSMLQRIAIQSLNIFDLHFYNCSFKSDNAIFETLTTFGDETNERNYQYLIHSGGGQTSFSSFLLENCKIGNSDLVLVIALSNIKFENFSLKNVDLKNVLVDLQKSTINESFIVEDCSFYKPFGVAMLNFPKGNTYVNWKQIDSLGIGIYNNPNNYTNAYVAKANKELIDVQNYQKLIGTYRKFLNMYRTQGDNESANTCFIRMRDIETKRLKYLYNQNSNLKNWFNLRFNQFLKYFSDYGTNPVKSLIISMWTILWFALFYFFFYSDWDKVNKAFLIKQHKKLLKYFSSEQKMSDFYTEDHKQDFIAYNEYKKELELHKIDVPFFVNILGKPLYHLSLAKYRIINFLYRRTEVLQGKWIDLNRARKISVGVAVSFGIIGYIAYLITIRVINSTILSINAFTTLGFGAIPVKGLSRYVTIMEGFIGWFLLSIFSVSLIGQILQN